MMPIVSPRRALVVGVLIAVFIGVAALVAQTLGRNLRPFAIVGPIEVPGRITIARGQALPELRARLNAKAAERARESVARARRLRAAIRHAGGFEQYLERSRANATERVRRSEAAGGRGPDLRDAQLHLGAINEALTHIRSCNKPWIWSQRESKNKY